MTERRDPDARDLRGRLLGGTLLVVATLVPIGCQVVQRASPRWLKPNQHWLWGLLAGIYVPGPIQVAAAVLIVILILVGLRLLFGPR